MAKAKETASNLKDGIVHTLAFIAICVVALLISHSQQATTATPDSSWSFTADSPQHYTECLLKFVEENNQLETLYQKSGLYWFDQRHS